MSPCGHFFFSFLSLWLISSFMPLWSEKMLEIISILLNSLRLVLCPSMWSPLENIGCAFLTVLLSFRICYLIDFLSRRYVRWCEWDVKSPTIIVFSSIYLLMSVSIFFLYIWVLLYYVQGFLGGSVVKNPPANAGDVGFNP